MSKETYLRFLRSYLTGRLPAGEVEEIVRYYTEYFADAGESREQAVMAELGSPERLAQQILGQRRQEELVPVPEPNSGYWQEGVPAAEYAPAVRRGIPTWAYILLLVLAAVFAGPVLVGLVFGLGLAGVLCVVIGLGVAGGAVGRFSLAGFLYQAGGGLIASAVGLVLLLGAILIVWLTAKLLRWFRNTWVEGGAAYEEGY